MKRADPASPSVDRRGFLRTATVAAAAVVAGEWAGRLLARVPGVSESAVAVGAIDALVVGEARAVVLPSSGQEALVVRLDATSLVAFERRCPHLGCPVLWSRQRACFECPCHDAAFDARSGDVLHGPPPHGLTPVTIDVRGSEVWLHPGVNSRQFTVNSPPAQPAVDCRLSTVNSCAIDDENEGASS